MYQLHYFLSVFIDWFNLIMHVLTLAVPPFLLTPPIIIYPDRESSNQWRSPAFEQEQAFFGFGFS